MVFYYMATALRSAAHVFEALRLMHSRDRLWGCNARYNVAETAWSPQWSRTKMMSLLTRSFVVQTYRGSNRLKVVVVDVYVCIFN